MRDRDMREAGGVSNQDSDSGDPLRNPADPLLRAGPGQQQELFRRFVREAAGFSLEDVIGAAMNVLINAVRQSSPTWRVAEARYDEWTSRFKSVMRSHFDASGRRRSVFPFHQEVVMDHFDSRDKVH